MDYDHLAVDLGNQITEMLSREMDFSAWQKSLTEIVNNSMLDMKAIISENMQQSTRAFADAFLRIDPVDITSAAAACLNSVTEQLNSSVYQNMASQLADTLLKSMRSVPLDDFAARPEIPVEEVQAALSDVRSCLPEEAADALDLKIKKEEEQSSGRIPWKTVMEIITFVICVLGFIKDCLPDEHEQRTESANSAIVENQEMEIELHEKEIALMQDILDCLKNRNDVAVEAQDTSVDTLDIACEDFKSVVDVSNLPNDSQEQETLNEAGSTEN